MTSHSSQTIHAPVILTVLGATGDLMARKIIPALFSLFQNKRLPEHFKVIGFSRRPWTDQEFQDHIKTQLGGQSPADLESFSSLFSYVPGTFDTPADYEKLATHISHIETIWGGTSNHLFYLSVPPELYATILTNLGSMPSTSPQKDRATSRIIIEKPFGNNLESSQNLNALLKNYFSEEAVYRVDHYLAKTSMENILHFRFSNGMFEPAWNRNEIEQIEVTCLETLGVEKRGAFYDAIGTLKDVGQNHLVEMLAEVTMEAPLRFDAEHLRQARKEALSHIHILSESEITTRSFRAQHRGYTEIPGVSPTSTTETYFKLQTYIESPRFQGIPVIFEAGKRLGSSRKEIVVRFKKGGSVTFGMQSEEAVTVRLIGKQNDYVSDFTERAMTASFGAGGAQYAAEYAKLLFDAMNGDQTNFVSPEETEQMWSWSDPISEAWKKGIVPLHTYEPGTDHVLDEASAFLNKA